MDVILENAGPVFTPNTVKLFLESFADDAPCAVAGKGDECPLAVLGRRQGFRGMRVEREKVSWTIADPNKGRFGRSRTEREATEFEQLFVYYTDALCPIRSTDDGRVSYKVPVNITGQAAKDALDLALTAFSLRATAE